MSAFKVLLGAAAAATLMMASSAQATIIASEDFESYTPTVHGDGAYDLNYTAFNHGFHVEGGTVDLIGTPNAWNLSGFHQYIDLDGSTNDGALLRSNVFAFSAGDVISFSF